MAEIGVRSIVGGVATATVLVYSHLGVVDINLPSKNYKTAIKQQICPEEFSAYPYYYTFVENQYRIKNQVEVLHNFVSNLIENTEDINPDFSQTVDKHFWDLI